MNKISFLFPVLFILMFALISPRVLSGTMSPSTMLLIAGGLIVLMLLFRPKKAATKSAQAVAQDVLDDLEPGYDFVFIDAAKSHYRTFWDKSVRLCNPGAIIISDNILMKGNTVLDRMEIIRRYRTSHGHMRSYLEYITNTDEADTALLPIGDGVAFSILKGNNE